MSAYDLLPDAKDSSNPYMGGPHFSQGLKEDVASGYQSSATGLLASGKMPDIVLDPHHAKWYDKALSGIGEVGSDIPEMAAGGAVGSLAGPLGTGAGMMAVPTAIRESLIKGYNSGEISSSADFLTRTKIAITGMADADVLKATAKAATVGALTAGTGGLITKTLGPVLGEAVMAGNIGAGTARVASDVSRYAGETGTMTVAPAALDGRLPERDRKSTRLNSSHP